MDPEEADKALTYKRKTEQYHVSATCTCNHSIVKYINFVCLWTDGYAFSQEDHGSPTKVRALWQQISSQAEN